METDVRGHKVILDQPSKSCGTDKGMNPGELLLSALGACQSMVASRAAKKFDIDLQNFWVELEGDIDPDGARLGFQTIRSTFHIESNAAIETIEAFKEFIEEHCPIGGTIAHSVNLVSPTVVVENPVK